MKRIVVILIALIVATNVNAQENSQTEDLNARIDSLTTKLNQLQHDFDFLDCRYKIDNLRNNISELSMSLEIKSNSITAQSYKGEYYAFLYEAYERYYASNIEQLNTLKSNVEQLKGLLFLKLFTSNFTETERELLKSSINVLDKNVTSAEASLSLFKAALDRYKSLD